MKLLLKISDKDVGTRAISCKPKQRRAARAVLVRDSKMALMHVTKQKFHKLPGGGIARSESIEEALFREMLEETGCKIRITGEVGKIIEHRTRSLLHPHCILQTSYCYVASVISKRRPKFDKGEVRSGHKLEWMSVNSAIEIMEKEKPRSYDGKFIVVRDLKFLKAAQKIINSKHKSKSG